MVPTAAIAVGGYLGGGGLEASMELLCTHS